ncbi:uncharacterized protein LOC143997544 [Lithobates pipiens]
MESTGTSSLLSPHHGLLLPGQQPHCDLAQCEGVEYPRKTHHAAEKSGRNKTPETTVWGVEDYYSLSQSERRNIIVQQILARYPDPENDRAFPRNPTIDSSSTNLRTQNRKIQLTIGLVKLIGVPVSAVSKCPHKSNRGAVKRSTRFKPVSLKGKNTSQKQRYSNLK